MKRYETLCRQLRQEILNGFRQKGDRLPSIRACARRYALSKTTVERAYSQLQIEGYIEARPKQGYYVALGETERQLHEQLLQPSFTEEQPPIRYDFRSQTVWADHAELMLWKQYLKKAMADAGIGAYGEAKGERKLRQALAHYAYTQRGVLAKAEQLLVGAGVQALLYQLCGLFDKTWRIGFQQGVYAQARRVFADYGFSIVDISFGEAHFSLADLKRQNIDVLFLYPPAFYDRDGFFTHRHEEQLLDWIKKNKIMLVEDDHNGELRYQRETMPALYAPQLEAVYLGSFSRILLPALRISYMVLPPMLLARYHSRIRMYGPTASKLEQLAFAEYIADGHLKRRIHRIQRQYRAKHKLLLSFLKEHGLALRQMEESLARYHVGVDAKPDVDRMLEQGIVLDGIGEGEVILSFSAIPPDRLALALEQLYPFLADQIKEEGKTI